MGLIILNPSCASLALLSTTLGLPPPATGSTSRSRVRVCSLSPRHRVKVTSSLALVSGTSL